MSGSSLAADARQTDPPSPDPSALLQLGDARSHGTAVVSVDGEIDLSTAGQVDARLEEVSRTAREHVVLDLTGVRFIDSTGLALLVRWARRADDGGPRFSVVADAGVARRVLEISGLLSLVELLPAAELADLTSG